LIAIAPRFGGDCTKSALENRFRRIKSDARLINDAVAKGVDVITINVGDTNGQVAMSSNKGSNGNAPDCFLYQHINMAHFTFSFRHLSLGKAHINFCAIEVAIHFGQGVKGPALSQHMRRHLAPNVTLLRDAVKNGQDPGVVTLGGLFGKSVEGKDKC
jgi:hypothetical protein